MVYFNCLSFLTHENNQGKIFEQVNFGKFVFKVNVVFEYLEIQFVGEVVFAYLEGDDVAVGKVVRHELAHRYAVASFVAGVFIVAPESKVDWRITTFLNSYLKEDPTAVLHDVKLF